MIILIAVTNSSLKLAKYNKQKILEQKDYTLADNYQSDIDKILNTIKNPSRVLITSSAGKELDKYLEQKIWDDFAVEPEYLHSGKTLKGLKNGYTKYKELSSNRWLTLIAAYNDLKEEGNKQAFCVIDCDKTITIDAVDSSGKHLGGFVTPGIQQVINVANKNMALTDQSKIRKPRSDNYFLANNDKHAVVGGIYYSVIAFIERILEDLNTVIDSNYKVFMTGSDADKIQSMLSVEKEINTNNDLLWQGMLSVL